MDRKKNKIKMKKYNKVEAYNAEIYNARNGKVL